MGKRKKTTRSTIKKGNPSNRKIEILFTCPVCMHSNVVRARRNKKIKGFNLKCQVCDVGHQAPGRAPIDSYTQWVDEIAQEQNEDEYEEE